jgi:hypothetical protein
MKRHFSLAFSLYVVILFLVGTTVQADEPVEDQRQRLDLKPEYQDILLLEMRHLLIAVAGITDGIVKGNPEQIAQAAKPMGMQAMHGTPAAMRKQLPPAFRQLGRQVHQQMDMIARDAQDLGDPQHSLNQLRDTLQTCLACHASYRLR